ncbi:MAG: acetaldehyde dehydrogenase (acetylating) [Ignavibacteriae bacterium]|nr:acetaldehyde dehydrogenase (acetylating) [Ignavibacteria bacterium]MBI3365160.1 acetaldehyde dehydrogenase (acetylating) [Ignavibacteriota bacterium]
MPLDKDLQSIQEMRDLVQKAKQAQIEFRAYDQARVDRIVKAMADAGYEAAERLGRMAHEETGFGKPDDKKKKNEFATRRVWESIKDLRTVGVIREDREKRIIEIAEPMGVVCALIPSTNPTSTVMFKAIISVKGRNGIVASPHPRAAKCTAEAMNVIAQAAEAAGAPQGLMGCINEPTLEATNQLMKHKLISVILATGSNPMVKSAYSSGKPCYGVGSGNVPAYIEKSANIRKAVADIVSGKIFDLGVLCSTEASVVVDAAVKTVVVEEFKRRNCYFVEGDDNEKLSRLMFDQRGAINPNMVGKPAAYIAKNAGINVPAETQVLVAELSAVGREYPLSREKLSPVLSFYTVDNWREGCERCIELLEFGGIGHTLVIHSMDEDIIMKFALEKPAFRILVNTQAALGAVGYTNELLPSMTLGPGTFGGSIISENVSAKHMINVKRLAFETRPINPPEGETKTLPASKPEIQPTTSHNIPPVMPKPSPSKSWMEEIDERIRMKAGNAPVHKKEEQLSHSESKDDGRTLGSGISEEDVERIIKDFSKR